MIEKIKKILIEFKEEFKKSDDYKFEKYLFFFMNIFLLFVLLISSFVKIIIQIM